MKVTRIETLRLREFANLCWVRVHTDEGVVGLGETFMGAAAVEAYIHETVAPYLLGKDPLQIDLHWRELYGYLGFRSSGVEMRGNSAIDIALWDKRPISLSISCWVASVATVSGHTIPALATIIFVPLTDRKRIILVCLKAIQSGPMRTWRGFFTGQMSWQKVC